MTRFSFILFAACLLTACDGGAQDGPLDIAIIGDEDVLFASQPPLPSGARHLRAASAEGLVSLDPAGQVVPAIAQRWIVTDDAMSYIFRLRDAAWPDGEPIRAEDAADALNAAIRNLDGTALGLDLEKITEVRAMTGQIIEIRLASPMPEFLRLLAQPELGLIHRGSGAGPMIVSRDEDGGLARLSALTATELGMPDGEGDEKNNSRALTMIARPARTAVDAFLDGEIGLVIGGTITDFPMAQLGPLSRGTIQVDPALGLFGLAFVQESDLLSEPARREALSMAIDRNELIQPFGLGGWQPNTWIVPQTLFSPLQYPATRWSDQSIEQRQADARRRISAWEAQTGQEARVRVALPPGPGSDLLFDQLSSAWRMIGLEAERAGPDEDAELVLRDLAAHYSSPRWFLNRFNCGITTGLCSPEADDLVSESLTLLDAADKQSLLADAHIELVEAEVFIPLGAPVRWSLVRGAVSAYQANAWSFHPLFPLSQPTT